MLEQPWVVILSSNIMKACISVGTFSIHEFGAFGFPDLTLASVGFERLGCVWSSLLEALLNLRWLLLLWTWLWLASDVIDDLLWWCCAAALVIHALHLEVGDLESEAKFAALAKLGLHRHFTVVLVDDALADVEAEANALLVLLVCVLQFAEHFEQL